MSCEFLTTTEFRNLTKVSISTMYKLIKSKSIPAVKIGGRWKIPSDTIRDYEKIADSPLYH